MYENDKELKNVFEAIRFKVVQISAYGGKLTEHQIMIFFMRMHNCEIKQKKIFVTATIR